MNCYQLFRVTDPTRIAPLVLQDVDTELCKAFNVPVDPIHWFRNWHNIIGLCLACGQTFQQIAADESWSDDTRELAAYMDRHYLVDAWAEVGRR